jgi:hypothetical protein
MKIEKEVFYQKQVKFVNELNEMITKKIGKKQINFAIAYECDDFVTSSGNFPLEVCKDIARKYLQIDNDFKKELVKEYLISEAENIKVNIFPTVKSAIDIFSPMLQDLFSEKKDLFSEKKQEIEEKEKLTQDQELIINFIDRNYYQNENCEFKINHLINELSNKISFYDIYLGSDFYDLVLSCFHYMKIPYDTDNGVVYLAEKK